MLGSSALAFFVGLGVAIWVYRKFSSRATGGDFIKTAAPALICGFVAFLVSLTIFWAVF